MQIESEIRFVSFSHFHIRSIDAFYAIKAVRQIDISLA